MKTIIIALAAVAALSTTASADTTKSHKRFCYDVGVQSNIAMAARQMGMSRAEAVWEIKDSGYTDEVLFTIIGAAFKFDVESTQDMKFQIFSLFHKVMYEHCLNNPADIGV
jgi:hypothetical protein